jgi:uncharacterized damage-inducible protein DinB
MIDCVRNMLTGQFEASLSMMNDCIRKCPDEQWDGQIAKYPFWQVAYHTLCFVDLYLSPNEELFQLRDDLHPQGWSELNEEFPSRRFDKREIAGYVAICRQKARDAIGAETRESLEGPSGFGRLPFSRAELYLYNIRHIQHHTGQLSAYLRRIGASPDWVKTG